MNITDARGKNVISPPLILPEKIYLPPLQIKLGLMKNFVKGMDKTGRGFEYVRNKFPNASDAKIKEGIFIGPQIRELMQEKQFNEDLNETKKGMICKDFLGNHKAVNYQYVVLDLGQSHGMQCEPQNPLSGVTLGFFPRKSRRTQ